MMSSQGVLGSFLLTAALGESPSLMVFYRGGAEALGASGTLASQQKGVPFVFLSHLGKPALPRWVGNTFRRGIKVIRQLKDKSHVTYWRSRGANPSLNIQACVTSSRALNWSSQRPEPIYRNWRLNPVQNRLATTWILIWVVHSCVLLQRLNWLKKIKEKV